MEITSHNIWTKYLLKISIAVIVFSVGIFILLLSKNSSLINKEIQERAADHIRHIVKTRAWNAHYGGVYVEKIEGVESNPYMEDADIETRDGKVYTLKNPALMTREISELFEKEGLLKYHLTSLKPLNPANAPDSFEEKALHQFEEGLREVSMKETVNDRTSFRYIVPLNVEKSCLKCHAKQGYKVGDIRGGISVWFDITEIEQSLKVNKIIITTLGIVTAVSLLGIIYAFTFVLMKKIDEAQGRIEELAIKDDLTGLYNRRYLNIKLKDEIQRSRRFKLNLGCIMLDIDFFKKVNDTFGHQAGDIILKNISAAVSENCRTIDTVARYGGEEIIIVLPGPDLKAVYNLAERIRAAVERLENEYEQGVTIPVTISLGVSSFTPDDLSKITSGDQIIKYTDTALYRAKDKGRNRVEIAESIVM